MKRRATEEVTSSLSRLMISLTLLLYTFLEWIGSAQGENYLAVCYFTNWAPMKLSPEARLPIQDINPHLCTHLIFAFAKVDPENLTLAATDPYDETKNGVKGNYAHFTDLKRRNPKLKTVLSIGGAKYSGEGFHTVIENRDSRVTFARNCITYIRDREFDGLDVDWEYPGDPPESKFKFTLLLKDLRREFENEARRSGNERLVLSAALGVAEEHIEESYEVDKIAPYLDFMSLMTYDYHGPWSGLTGLNSPLFSRADNIRFHQQLSQEWSVNRWVEAGAPREKLVLGIAASGRTFTLQDNSTTGVGAPAIGPGIQGEFTLVPGVLSYYEICNFLSDGGEYQWDDIQKTPFAYKENQWVGFDDPKSVQAKTEWMIQQRLGGVMIWSLDLDDFSGTYCGQGKFPLTSAMKMTIDNMTLPEIPETTPPKTTEVLRPSSTIRYTTKLLPKTTVSSKTTTKRPTKTTSTTESENLIPSGKTTPKKGSIFVVVTSSAIKAKWNKVSTSILLIGLIVKFVLSWSG
ncbi:chitotriosidase-1-like [Liolophura sinensis]|uniref:chitotriosidase-1-like n=1 Tax=Liolophura sinensis TaxID=3198878 RepID=UPI00315926D1